MRVTLTRLEGARFEAKNARGHTVTLDGPPTVGGMDSAARPMEIVLIGLGGCSAMDVLMIMEKQRQPLGDLEVVVEAKRADAIPAVFTEIHVRFVARGAIDPAKLERAVSLSMEKYCSVTKMLEKTAEITHSTEIVGAA